MASFVLAITFWRASRREEFVAEGAAARFIRYLESLEAVEPSLAHVGLDNPSPDKARRPELADLIRALRRNSLVLSLYDGDDDTATRRITYSSGSPMAPARTDIGAKPDLMTRSDALRRILSHGIEHWEAHEAGVYRIDEEAKHRFWLRWRPDDVPSPIPRLPLEPGWASAEPWLGGTLYTWPEHEPVRIIGEAQAEGSAAS